MSGRLPESPPACSSFTTAAAPTSTTCSASPTSWTPTGDWPSSPRAPLAIGGGYHWYVVPRVGYPDPDTFHAAYRKLAAFHDELWERTGIAPENTVLGGFSMGSVMSYALGLAGDRPVPAGILAFSGFVPTVEGWEPDLGSRPDLPVLIAHGRRDPVMDVEFARGARALLQAGGLPVEYHESEAAHHIDPAHVPAAIQWLAGATAEDRSATTTTTEGR